MKNIFVTGFYFIFATVCFGQAIPVDSLYLGQTPPGATPKIFQLPVSSGMRAVERIAITADGKEIYYGELDTYPPTFQRIKSFKYLNNKWQGPFVAFEGYIGPALSVNDSIMYMQKNINSVACTYYSIRNDTGWTIPIRLLLTNLQTHYFQRTDLNNCYVSSVLPSSPGNNDICKLLINNTDTTIQSLGMPVNTSATENDFYIAKDEKHIIICRTSAGSASDMYISYKNDSGNWKNPKSLGIQINTPDPNWEYGPFITKDNKYLFFTRGGNNVSSYYVYWVRFDNLLDSLRHTNFIPYVKNPIPNQTAVKGVLFNLTFPDSMFYDDDGDSLTYSAGNLPSWLSFNSATRTFSGTPPTNISRPLYLNVIATDTAEASGSCMFYISFTNPSGVSEDNHQSPEQFTLAQNYPNPFNPSTVISYQLPVISDVKLSIIDVLGREVATLVNDKKPAGSYAIQWNAAGMPSGTYFYRLQADAFTETKKLILLK